MLKVISGLVSAVSVLLCGQMTAPQLPPRLLTHIIKADSLLDQFQTDSTADPAAAKKTFEDARHQLQRTIGAYCAESKNMTLEQKTAYMTWLHARIAKVCVRTPEASSPRELRNTLRHCTSAP